jgi:hypothetical protein
MNDKIAPALPVAHLKSDIEFLRNYGHESDLREALAMG